MKKSSNIQPPLKIPLLVRLSGLAASIYSQCTESTRNRIKIMGATLIITPALSGLIIAYAFSGLAFQQRWAFVPIFVVWTLLIYTLDCLLIANVLNRVRVAARIIAALVFSMVHALVIDTLCFRSDIELALEEERQSKIDGIRQRANEALHPYRVRIDSLKKTIADQHEKIISEQIKLELENNGQGGSGKEGVGLIYKQQASLAGKIETEARAVIELHTQNIADLRQEMMAVEKQAEIGIASLPATNAHGLIHRLEKLHELVFVKRKGIVIAFFFIWFIVSCIIELLPLLAKSNLNINEYLTLEAGAEQTNVSIYSQEQEKTLAIEKEKILLQYYLDERQLRSDHELKLLEGQLQHLVQELEVKESYLEQILNKQQDMHTQKSGEFAYHGQPAFDKALREFETITS